MHKTVVPFIRGAHPLRGAPALRPMARALVAGAVLSLSMLPSRAQVLPTGLQVIAGQAQAATVGGRMTVVNSPNAILNWNTFSIGSGQAVYFQQANAASQVLNRVVGNDPSQILGQLGSNGRVWLLNPNGVLFGQGARVDVAGLVASSLSLGDGDWLAGRYRLGADGRAAASVVNQGELRSTLGGRVALVATEVRNEGLVQAPGGQVVLAAGQSVELIDTGAPNLGVRITAPAGAVRNLGSLQAAGGRIDVHAASVNQQGIVSADSLSAGPGGEVWIKASQSVDLGPDSRTTADASGGGGKVHIESVEGRTTLQGSVSVKSDQGRGGQVALLGREVGVMDGARVDASGSLGGGEVLVGGGVQGRDPRVANAQAVYFGPQARIAADALTRGDGGSIVLWSDQATRAFGALSARGGALSGHGGQIETSGGWLDARPAQVDTRAPAGQAGRWLLDPSDITISDSFTSDSGVGANFSVTGASASISSSTINSALVSGNVTISTGGGTGGSGDINVTSATLGNSFSTVGTLSLDADRNIVMTGSEFGGGPSTLSGLTLRAGLGGTGGITIHNSSIDTGGKVALFGNSVSLTGFTSVVSWAAGDAIVLAGSGNGAMTQFTNSTSAGSGVLSAPGGRWIVYFDDITSPSFNHGGLTFSYDFKRYGSAFDGWIDDSGDGLVFRAPQTAVVSTGTVQTRPYDGTTNAPVLSNASASGFGGESGFVVESVTAHYADKNAGVGKAITIDPASFEFMDSFERPIYGYSVSTTLTGTVTPLALSGNAVARSKIYDGTAATVATVPSLTGVVSGDSVLVIADATFRDKNVGKAKPVTVTGGFRVLEGSGGVSPNYTYSPFASTAPLVADISPRPLNVVGLGANDKVYDGTVRATLIGTPRFDALPGDQISMGAVTASFLDKNVGQSKTVQIGGLTLSGADAGNYQLQPVPSVTASITPRPIDVSGLGALNKVYDGTTLASLSGSGSINPLAGDQVSLVGTLGAAFADKNAGLGKPVFLTGVSLSGVDAGNYSINANSTLLADITPLPVTVSGAVASNKVYDGTVLATLAPGATVKVLAGDDARLAPEVFGSFADKNVGTGKEVSLSGVALVGADAGNYSLAPVQGLKADITPRSVSLGGLAVADKVYDATTSATLSGSATFNAVAGDVLSLSGSASASFADKGVGQSKPVTLSGLALSGADAGNYTLQALQLTGNITPRPLPVGGLSALDKVYDASSAATLSGTASIAGLAGDVLTLGGVPNGSFADKNAGQAKAVTISGLLLGGADAGNYSLSLSGLAASITPRPLLVSGLTALDKTYDAGILTTLAGTASVAGLAGDVITLAGTASGRFSDKNVGTGKAVGITGLSLAGADAGNYSLVAPDALRASITPLTVAVQGLAATDKLYDGGTSATLAGNARVNALVGDSVSVGGTALANFVDRNVGSGKSVSVQGFSLTGVDAGNYRLTQPFSLAASITPATLQYVAAPDVRSTGQPLDGLTGTVSGFVGGDSLASATQGAAAFTTLATPDSPPGNYAILGSGLQAGNYVFKQAPGNANALTIVVDLTPVVSTIVGSDTAGPPAAPPPPAPPVSGINRPLPGAGTLDLTSAAPPAPIATTSGAGGGSNLQSDVAGVFRPVKLSGLSANELQSLLAARAQFMQNLLSDSVGKLERNPALADLRECMTLQQAEQGECLVTAQLKSRIASAATSTPAPTAAPTAAPSAAPTAATGTGPGAVPGAPAIVAAAPAPAVAPAAVPVPAAAPAPAAPVAPAASAMATIASQFDRLVATPSVRSASLPQIQRKIALVVGVDRYADASIPTLANAVRDANAVAKVFETRLGYQAVVLENATRSSLVAALNRLALTVGPRDSVVVYYAGHGELVESTKLGYWLLSDSVAKSPETWLSNTDINRMISQIGASQVALVSDSCYSGSLVSEERIRPQATPPNPSLILDRKSVVVMSSGGNEPVFDDSKDGHSPFAFNLMNTLGQLSNWQPGGNVFERVRFAVARTLPQRPQYSSSRAAGHQAGGDYLFEERRIDIGR